MAINSLCITDGKFASVLKNCIAAIACTNPALIGNIGNKGVVTLAKKIIFLWFDGHALGEMV